MRKRLANCLPASTIEPMLLRIVLSLLLLLSGCTSSGEIKETRFMMGTLVEFTISGTDKETAMAAIRAASDEMQRVDNLFTIYGDLPDPVKKLNAAEVGRPMPLPEEISRLLRTSMAIQDESGGAFNPSLGELDQLWGFSEPEPRTSPPSAKEISQLLPPRNCFQEVAAGWIRQNQRCALDFGAIAKGYAIDRGIAALQAHGIRNAIIDAGGDIRLLGDHDGKPWRIGVRHPRQPGGVIATLELRGDVSIVSSGDYERYFIYHGQRYHHILNPDTGWPATGIESATVIAPTATLADGWSTALFVKGAAGLPILQKKGYAALLVDSNGKLLMTDNMRKIIHLP